MVRKGGVWGNRAYKRLLTRAETAFLELGSLGKNVLWKRALGGRLEGN